MERGYGERVWREGRERGQGERVWKEGMEREVMSEGRGKRG